MSGPIFKINKICEAYQLGECVFDVSSCVGGLQHQSYKFKTSKGFFIAKFINPAVNAHSNVKERYQTTEIIAREFEKKLPVISAITNENYSIFTIDDQLIMIFPFVNARTLSHHEISIQHAEKIGFFLAKIHEANIKIPDAPTVEFPNIHFFPNEIAKQDDELTQRWHICLPVLDHIYEACVAYEDILKTNLIISHRDLDPKNVLWENEKAYLIDWESTGLINQTKDLISTAMYWSLGHQHQVKLDYLAAFLLSYKKNRRIIYDDIEAGLYGLLGDWIMWLNFNFTRMLKNPTESEEYQLGLKEAGNTLTAIPIVFTQVPKLIKKIKNLI